MAEETNAQPGQDDETEAAEATEAADALPAIGVDVAEAGMLRKKITVTVPRARLDAKTDEMFGELSHTAQVPGFRVGRAPRRLIEKRFGKEVAADVRNAILGESIGKAVETSELKTLGEPEIDLDAIELPESGDLTFDFEVEVRPEFDLPKLEGIPVQKRKIEIDDARVDEMLDAWRQGHARYEPTDKAAEAGDMVTAAATIIGEGIEEHRPGLRLRVAAGQIEGLPLVELGEALAGKKAGQAAELSVTVPDAHPNEDWRGKQLKIVIDISQVSRRILPEITNEFAAGYGFDTVEELREQIRRNLTARVDSDIQRDMRDQLCGYLLENTEFELPENVVARHTDSVLQRRYVDLLYRGVAPERIDENLTELQAAASEQARRDMKLLFIMDQICEAEQIEVTPEEINSRIAEMARSNNRRPERLRQELAQEGRLGQVEMTLREEKALNRLLEKADITEVKPEAAGEQDEGKTRATQAKKAKKAKKKSTSAKASKKSAKKAPGTKKDAGKAK